MELLRVARHDRLQTSQVDHWVAVCFFFGIVLQNPSLLIGLVAGVG
jgi:hypothetical protein